MLTIGVTGGIGSGKTTVTDMFQQLSISVIDADVIARTAVAKGSAALTEITNTFGEDILLDDGELDRKKMRAIVFDDEAAKVKLEMIIHPRVRQHIQQRLTAAHGPYVVLSSPLLIESQQIALVDRVLVVDIPKTLQLARTCKRDDASHEQISKIIHNQITREQRLAAADDIIDNASSLEQTQRQVEELHQLYLEAAANQNS